MNAPSPGQLDVIAIKRLDTAALLLLRTAAVSPSLRSPRPAPPAALGVVRPARAGRRLALATFALGSLLGVLSSRLGETGSTDVAARASVASEQALRPAPPAAPVAASQGAPEETSDAPRTTTPFAERSPATEPSSTTHVGPRLHSERTKSAHR